MSDLSSLSDDELKALYSKGASQPASGISSLSDEDLKALYQSQQPKTAGGIWNAIKSAGLGGQGELESSTPEAVEGLKTTGGELAKGVPIAGALAPQTAGMTQLESEHPGLAKGLQIAGGTAALVPAAAAAPVAFGLEGPAALRLGASALTGGSVNAADTAARGGTAGDTAKAFGVGAVAGAAPIVGGKLISPALSETVAKRIAGPASRAIYGSAGYAASHAAGLPGEPGALMGLLIGEGSLRSPIYKYLTNNMLARVLTRAPQAAEAAAPAAYPSNVIDLAKVLADRNPAP